MVPPSLLALSTELETMSLAWIHPTIRTITVGNMARTCFGRPSHRRARSCLHGHEWGPGNTTKM